MVTKESFSQISQRIHAEIQDHQHALVPNTVPVEESAKLARVFVDFCESPLGMHLRHSKNDRKMFHRMIDENRKGSDIGFIVKKKDWGDGDSKSYFHYHPNLEVYVPQFTESNLEFEALLQQARTVHSFVKSGASRAIDAIDAIYPGLSKKFGKNGTLRVLAYDRLTEEQQKEAMKPENFLARMHYDLGTLTYAFWESDTGYMSGSKERLVPVSYDHDGNYALLFRGRGAVKGFDEFSNPEVWPWAWHGVGFLGGTPYSETVQRVSQVYFSDAKDKHNFSDAETHTPLFV